MPVLKETRKLSPTQAERIIEFLDREPEVKEHAWARPLPSVRGIVELDGVSFQYPGTENPALDNVSLRVWPGETLALVGPSGSGKSTIAKLLLRFLDPDDGTACLDGHDLRDLTLRSVRENVAVLFQETLLFDGSMRRRRRSWPPPGPPTPTSS
jgi:subfamily B ATP-binding cassette protein MsbA